MKLCLENKGDTLFLVSAFYLWSSFYYMIFTRIIPSILYNISRAAAFTFLFLAPKERENSLYWRVILSPFFRKRYMDVTLHPDYEISQSIFVQSFFEALEFCFKTVLMFHQKSSIES